MDSITLHRITFAVWSLIGFAFVIFTDRVLKEPLMTKDIIVKIIFVGLGPGGWMGLGLMWVFQKQYRKNSGLVSTLAFLGALLITIALMYAAFPLIRPM